MWLRKRAESLWYYMLEDSQLCKVRVCYTHKHRFWNRRCCAWRKVSEIFFFFRTKLINVKVNNICESIYANDVNAHYVTEISVGWLYSHDFSGNSLCACVESVRGNIQRLCFKAVPPYGSFQNGNVCPPTHAKHRVYLARLSNFLRWSPYLPCFWWQGSVMAYTCHSQD